MPKRISNNLRSDTEYLIWFSKNSKQLIFNIIFEARKPQWSQLMIKYNRGGPTGKPIYLENKILYPPEGYSWAIGNEIAQKMFKNGELKIENDKPFILLTKKFINNNWTDIGGYSFEWRFLTENSEKLLKRCVEMTSNKTDIVIDFFLGSGTTTAVAHKLGRKWLGVEMGEHFYSVVLPRMKKVLAYDKSGISKEVKDYQGGGFFKYYELEQYEDVLRRAHYEDATLFNDPSQDPYHAYVFRPDLKLLESLEADAQANTVHFHPERLYPDIDLAETLSHLRGKWIKRITADYVEFEDGEQMSLTDPDWQTLKPMIWWQ